jgi:1,4-alpha-glucan branching enzyme
VVSVQGNVVEFNFYRPQAGRVHLAGDFNGWRTDGVPMVRTPGGYWQTRLHLPVGEFKFRYCADGQWFTDFGAFGVEHGDHGLNSVVRVQGESH